MFLKTGSDFVFEFKNKPAFRKTPLIGESDTSGNFTGITYFALSTLSQAWRKGGSMIWTRRIMVTRHLHGCGLLGATIGENILATTNITAS